MSCHIEKNEAEEDGRFALVLDGPKAGWEMAHEVGDSHLAAQNECYSAGEKSERDERAADDLSNSRHTQQRKERHRSTAEEAKNFLLSVAKK